jgi:hypothetical protein
MRIKPSVTGIKEILAGNKKRKTYHSSQPVAGVKPISHSTPIQRNVARILKRKKGTVDKGLTSPGFMPGITTSNKRNIGTGFKAMPGPPVPNEIKKGKSCTRNIKSYSSTLKQEDEECIYITDDEAPGPSNLGKVEVRTVKIIYDVCEVPRLCDYTISLQFIYLLPPELL